jgi:hypothetical protein
MRIDNNTMISTGFGNARTAINHISRRQSGHGQDLADRPGNGRRPPG